MRGISVLVVDDHAAFADAVRSELESDIELTTVAVAYGLEEATSELAILRPDVALVNLQLSDGTGIDLAKRARTLSPATRIVMMSATDSPDAVFHALLQGVRIWLPKTMEAPQLARAVRLAVRGGAWLPVDVLGPVLDALVDRATGITTDPLAPLSRRELEILDGLAAGKNRAELATALHLSVNTIRSHVQNIIAKLKVHTTLEAVALYNKAQRL
jgi:DNA-binding NarL/FixJ family response regulator